MTTCALGLQSDHDEPLDQALLLVYGEDFSDTFDSSDWFEKSRLHTTAALEQIRFQCKHFTACEVCYDRVGIRASMFTVVVCRELDNQILLEHEKLQAELEERRKRFGSGNLGMCTMFV